MPIDSDPKLRAGAWLYLDVMTEGMQVCATREEAEGYVHEGQWCQVVLQIAEVYPGGRPNRALLEMRAARVAEQPEAVLGPPSRPYSIGLALAGLGMLPAPPAHMAVEDDGPGLEAGLEALGLRKVRTS